MATPLRDAITDTLDMLRSIPYSWPNSVYGSVDKVNPSLLLQKVQTWNDQINRMKNGKGFGFAWPACFLELVSNETTQVLSNVTETDYTFRMHLVDVELDAGDDNLDQNLTVMEYRDLIKTYMVGFQPSNCSTLFFINDDQDFEHSDVYHYVIDFRGLFVDTKGSILDPDQVKVIYKEPDTDLQLDLTIETE